MNLNWRQSRVRSSRKELRADGVRAPFKVLSAGKSPLLEPPRRSGLRTPRRFGSRAFELQDHPRREQARVSTPPAPHTESRSQPHRRPDSHRTRISSRNLPATRPALRPASRARRPHRSLPECLAPPATSAFGPTHPRPSRRLFCAGVPLPARSRLSPIGSLSTEPERVCSAPHNPHPWASSDAVTFR